MRPGIGHHALKEVVHINLKYNYLSLFMILCDMRRPIARVIFINLRFVSWYALVQKGSLLNARIKVFNSSFIEASTKILHPS